MSGEGPASPLLEEGRGRASSRESGAIGGADAGAAGGAGR
jgi:hypothetical protein